MIENCEFIRESAEGRESFVIFDPASAAMIVMNARLFDILRDIFKNHRNTSSVLRRYKVRPGEFQKVSQNIITKLTRSRVRNPDSCYRDDYTVLDTLKLNITGRCNLRCSYCYADFGSYKESSISEMSEKTMMNALNKFSGIFPRIDKIAFFGGEPLLNFPLIVSVIKKASRLKGVSSKFSMDTNGTILTVDPVLRKIEIFVSIDGTKKFHDRYRRTANNKPTYDRIRYNLVYLKNNLKDFHYHIQCTVTPEMARRIGDFDKIYLNLTKDFRPDSISLNPVAFNGAFDLDLVEFYKDRIDELFEQKDRDVFRGDQSILQLIYMIISNQRTERICPAGSTSFTVNFNGSVYPCHLAIRSKLKLFDINTDDIGTIRIKISEFQKGFGRIFRKDTPECEKCWIRRFCSGCIPRFTYPGLHRDDFCQSIKKIMRYLIVKLAIVKKSPGKWDNFVTVIKNRR